MEFTEKQIAVVAERLGCGQEDAEDALQYAFGSWAFYSYLKDWIDNQRFLLLESVCGKYRKKVCNLPLMALLRLRDEQEKCAREDEQRKGDGCQSGFSRLPACDPEALRPCDPEALRPCDPHGTDKKETRA